MIFPGHNFAWQVRGFVALAPLFRGRRNILKKWKSKTASRIVAVRSKFASFSNFQLLNLKEASQKSIVFQP